MNDDLSIFDLLLTPIYILVIWSIARFIQNKNRHKHSEYKYFTTGVMVKIVGAIALGLVYAFYYKGGDTFNYFETARAYVNLSHVNFENFLEGWLGNPTRINASHFFSEETGYPVYYHPDHHSFFVVRLLIPIVFLAGKSYFASATLTAFVTFWGSWRLYQIFVREFPMLQQRLFIAVICIPSCVFWGSGLMKDSFTLSATGWFTYGFYYFFILKKRRLRYVGQVVLASFIILAIKPYIFFALLPGSILWLSNQQIKKINNAFLRFMITPLLLTLGIGGGYFVLVQMGDSLGLYRIDTVLDRAVIVQQDMKADYYGGNTFDIGNFDASIGGVLAKTPSAIFAGIFRPALWDARNIVMVISSLENTYLLLLALFLLVKLKLFGFFRFIGDNPLVLFMMLFSLFFAFSVGLTVANFGSLVRLRIPELPFFVSGLFILRHLYEQKSGTKLRF